MLFSTRISEKGHDIIKNMYYFNLVLVQIKLVSKIFEFNFTKLITALKNTTYKVPLKKVLNNYDLFQPLIEQTVLRANEFDIRGYAFIKLYILYNVDGKILQVITEKFIRRIFSILSESKKCELNDGEHEELKSFYYTHIKPISKEPLNNK